MLHCHVLKGFGIYAIMILGSLSDVVGGFSCISFTHHVFSSCNLLVNIKGLESTFFLFLPLTKLPHPNTPLMRHQRRLTGVTMCVRVCVCVCVFSSHLFWTSTDVPAGATQEEGNTGFSIHLLSTVLALIFSREGFRHSFPSSTVKSNFVY